MFKINKRTKALETNRLTLIKLSNKESLLEKITFRKINEAANNGEFECTVYHNEIEGDIFRKVMVTLYELGYKVSLSRKIVKTTGKDIGVTMEISWRELSNKGS